MKPAMDYMVKNVFAIRSTKISMKVLGRKI